jgi:hypothetical protein
MNRAIAWGAALLAAGCSAVHADATLVYEAREADAPKLQKTFSINGFFVRVDFSDEKDKYLLYQAGKFFPLFSVNTAQGTFSRLSPPVEARLGPANRGKPAQAEATPEAARAVGAASPAEDAKPSAAPAEAVQAITADTAPAETDQAVLAAAEGAAEDAAEERPEAQRPPQPTKAPVFQPTTDTAEVAGVRCRIVQELIDGKPAIEHCMANKAALGITEREVRTLARLFVLAREREWDWLGAATTDEEFVSVRSRDPARNKTLVLESVSTDPLPAGHLRVPKGYKEIKP